MKSDFKIRYTRGTGPGGQHKNKTDSCVIITHIPTGMQERCEDSRSQGRNKTLAMERLEKRIKEKKLLDQNEKRNELRKSLIQNNKTIRTYNYPRNEVIDHRTGKRANLKKVMDGDLDLIL